MAQINVMDAWWTDPRRLALGRLVQSQELTDGLMLSVWRCAQTYHQKQDGIPLVVWKAFPHHESIVAVGLAEIIDGAVYVRGTKECFAWLAKKREAGALGGIKSGETRRSRTKQNEAERSTSEANASKSNPISISISNSIASKTKEKHFVGDAGLAPDSPPTVSVKNLETQKPPARGKRSPEQSAKISRFVVAYVTAYQARFGEGARPEDLSDPKVRGQIAGFAADHPDVERACQLVQVYFQTQNPWFEKRGWDFLTFRSNLALLGQALDSGQQPGGINWTKLAGEIKAEEERRFGSRGNT